MQGTLSASMPYEAHSGASIAQSAIERKQKMKIDTPSTSSAAPYPAQQVETPKGNDGKKYRNNLIPKDISRVLEIKLINIMIFKILMCSNS